MYFLIIFNQANSTSPVLAHIGTIEYVVNIVDLFIYYWWQTIFNLTHDIIEMVLDSGSQCCALLLVSVEFASQEQFATAIILDIVLPLLLHLPVESFERAL